MLPKESPTTADPPSRTISPARSPGPSRRERRGSRPAATTFAGMVPATREGIRATPELWDRLMALAAAQHPAIAEFCWSTLHLWCRADRCRLFRIGQFLVVPLGD